MMRGAFPMALLAMAVGLFALMVSFGFEPGDALLYAIAIVAGMTWALWPRPSDEDDFL